MAIRFLIPTPLVKLTHGSSEVEADGATVMNLIDDLEKRYPGMQKRLCDESGKLRRFINVFVNEEDIRFGQGEATALKDGDAVSLIPAVAGGAESARTKGSLTSGQFNDNSYY